METTTTIYTGLPLFASSVQMNTRTDYYRLQEKVMFSVNLSVHRGGDLPPDRDPLQTETPSLRTETPRTVKVAEFPKLALKHGVLLNLPI